MRSSLTSGSLFAGIGGFDLGLERAGIRTLWQVESDPSCRQLLHRRFPHAKQFRDIRYADYTKLIPVDIITAGVPCQDVSVAGRRAGLAGSRTGLFYEFARILQELQPRLFIFENVPGILSSNQGRDWAEILRVWTVQCGYGVSWRVLDSGYFGVAQRRRRVFAVGYLGAVCPAEILFELSGGARDSQAGAEAGADLAVTLTSGVGVTGNAPGRRREDDFNLVAAITGTSVCATLNSGGNSGGFRTGPREHSVAAMITASYGKQVDSSGRNGGPPNLIQQLNGVRRLTPTECERLQGFPDDWTADQSDSVRYRQLGNAVTVNVAHWIAQRIVRILSIA